MTYLTLAAGVVYLLMGADLLVRGAVALARRARVSETVVALTVVAFGTSLPELVVAVEAALLGYPGIVLGNVVGSNIANVMLVVGLAAVIWPLSSQEASSRRDAGIMVGGSILFAAACVTGQVHWGWALVLLGAMVAASIPSVRDAARAQRTTAGSTPLDSVLGLPTQRRFIWLFIVLGLIGLPMGAQMVVESAVAIGQAWGISEEVVGLTVVAVSTSLPELATAVVAAWQHRSEVIIGTVLGSNVFNALGIMAAAALVSPAPIEVPGAFLKMDIPVMLLAALILAAFAWARRPIRRPHGILLTAGYLVYLGTVFAVL